MQSTAARVTVGVVAVGIVVVAFIVLSGGDDSDDSTTNTTPTVATTGTTDTGKADKGSNGDAGDEADAGIPVIQIKDGQPVGGVQDLSFNEGDDIKFEVQSDTPGAEIHFHGYDIPQDLDANGTTTFDVPATITGIFEVEIEDTATQIAQITVNP
jgi:hypothetical protein